MRAAALGPSVELPMGPRARGAPKWVPQTHVNPANGAFGGAPYGATKRVRGVPNWVCVTHAGGATGANHLP